MVDVMRKAEKKETRRLRPMVLIFVLIFLPVPLVHTQDTPSLLTHTDFIDDDRELLAPTLEKTMYINGRSHLISQIAILSTTVAHSRRRSCPDPSKGRRRHVIFSEKLPPVEPTPGHDRGAYYRSPVTLWIQKTQHRPGWPIPQPFRAVDR